MNGRLDGGHSSAVLCRDGRGFDANADPLGVVRELLIFRLFAARVRPRRLASPKKREPCQQAPEIVSSGGEDGVDGVALAMGQEVPVHSVVFFGVADQRFDGGAAFELAFDSVGYAAFLSLRVNLELVFLRVVVTLVSGVGEDAGKGRAPVIASMPGSTVLSVCPS